MRIGVMDNRIISKLIVFLWEKIRDYTIERLQTR
jgi:hypothetical protein